jgi:adenylate kinase
VNQPPKTAGVCDSCGGGLYQREDDKPEVVRTRIEVNLEKLEALLSHYRRQGKLAEIDGERDVDAITAAIAPLLQAN